MKLRRMKTANYLGLLGGFLLLLSQPSAADVRLPRIFSDGMVLQREQLIRIWGWADVGERVTVGLKDQRHETVAGADGRWQLALSPELAGGPFELVVSGRNSVSFTDVWIGEVWVCSGQSNMRWVVKESANAEQEIADADYPQIRQVLIPRRMAASPLDDVGEALEWKTATAENVGDFTAVGYFYARELYRELKVPIGLINTVWGGTRLESWISIEGMYRHRELSEAARVFEEVPKDSLNQADKPNTYPTLLFNAMISPLLPYTIKGIIWYQGEANTGRAYQYREAFPLLINDWRGKWGLGDFPFYFAQLSSFKALGGNSNMGSTWAELREAQHMTLALPRTGQAITIDIGNTDDIHPRNKQDVGKRLAGIALFESYGQDVVYSGPTYRKHRSNGNQVIIDFDHVHGGLTTHDGSDVIGFEIAGSDRVFHPAEALIAGNQIIVTSPAVSKPKAVRYAWADDPGTSNLFNMNGLPAAPFRTDDWSGITKGKLYVFNNQLKKSH